MFLYYLRLAKLSLSKQPMLTALMIAAIGIGIGACMTVTAYLYVLSSDPIPEKSAHLYAVRLDSWGADQPFSRDYPWEAPWQLTQRDSVALLESPIPVRQAAMRRAVYSAIPANDSVAPFFVSARMTGRDFFDMFQVPFLYGGPWSVDADKSALNTVVLSHATNEKLFGGENSVGREARLGSESFVVAGVMDRWQPTILFYDVNNGPMNDVEDVFLPWSIAGRKEIDGAGNTNCFKDELIETYWDMLESECVYNQFWAEIASSQDLEAYQVWLDTYTEGQKELGRFERPTNNRLSTVTEYMEIRGVAGDEAWVIMCIGVLFLIACMVNTIGLILARFVAKSPIIALRRALGASKAQIFRQHLVEVGLVGFAGGILGLGLSYAGLAGLRMILEEAERAARLRPELIAMTIAIAVLSAMLAGLYPTWRICRVSPASFLKTQ